MNRNFNFLTVFSTLLIITSCSKTDKEIERYDDGTYGIITNTIVVDHGRSDSYEFSPTTEQLFYFTDYGDASSDLQDTFNIGLLNDGWSSITFITDNGEQLQNRIYNLSEEGTLVVELNPGNLVTDPRKFQYMNRHIDGNDIQYGFIEIEDLDFVKKEMTIYFHDVLVNYEWSPSGDLDDNLLAFYGKVTMRWED